MLPSPVAFLHSNKSKVTILSKTQVIKKKDNFEDSYMDIS